MRLHAIFKNSFSLRKMLLAVLTAAFFASPAVRGAVTEVGPNGEGLHDAAEEANRYLGNVFKDENVGLEFAPPAGARMMKGAGLSLVTFVNDQKQSGGNLQLVRLKEKQNLDEFCRSCVTDLGKSFRAVQVIETRDITVSKHKAVCLTTSMEGDLNPGGAAANHGERLPLYRQQLIIQMTDNQFYVLTFYTALKDRQEATATFNAMVASFELLDKDEVNKHKLAAINRAKDWLAQRSAEELKTKLFHQPQCYRMKVGGKDIGFVRFDEVETERPPTKGILVQINSRSWLPDGSPCAGQNSAYWAYSHDEKNNLRAEYSEWLNKSETIATVNDPKVQGGKYTFWTQEGGTLTEEGRARLEPETLKSLQDQRTLLIQQNPSLPPPPQIEEWQRQHHMLVTWTGDKTQAFQASDKSLDVMIPDYRPIPLPKILEYVWPRLVDLNKPGEMTFTTYNNSTRKISLRTLSVIGPDSIAIGREHVACIKCTDEMDNGGTTLWVDARGKILRMLTSDQSILEPINEDELPKDLRIQKN